MSETGSVIGWARTDGKAWVYRSGTKAASLSRLLEQLVLERHANIAKGPVDRERQLNWPPSFPYPAGITGDAGCLFAIPERFSCVRSDFAQRLGMVDRGSYYGNAKSSRPLNQGEDAFDVVVGSHYDYVAPKRVLFERAGKATPTA